MTTCPTCGRDVRAYAARVVPLESRDGAVIDGKLIKMRPLVFELLDALLRNYPRTVTYDQLIADLHGGDEPEHPKDGVQVYVCLLRRALKGSAASVETAWMLGLRLKLADPAPAEKETRQCA